MQRPKEQSARRAPRTSPLSTAPRSRARDEGEQHQRRESHASGSSQPSPLPLHRRSVSQSSSDDSVHLGNPGAQEVAVSPYPVPATSFVRHAMQFYIKQYSPTAVQRPHFVGIGQDVSLLRDYIPFVMGDRMVFSALVAMASFAAQIASTGDREAPPESIRFYQSAVSQVRQRLSSESDRSSDAVIVTLSNLSGFEALSGNYSAVDMHTLGIKQVVALRGGPDQLGFEGFLKTMALAWQNFYAARHSMNPNEVRFFPRDGIFTYPEHPFNPHLCDLISKFRPGLTDIALSGMLSHQTINLIAHVNTWEQDFNTSLRETDLYNLHELSRGAQNVTLCGQFLHKRGLPISEQLLVLAVMAFCYSTDASRSMFYLTNAYLQIRCKHMRSLHIEVTERNETFVTWVGTMLVATFDPAAQPCLLGLQLLKARPNSRNWQANVRICEDFFWNDGLSLKLASKIAHLGEGQGLG